MLFTGTSYPVSLTNKQLQSRFLLFMNELALYYMKLYYFSDRGVSMAMKMPSRILKKECAGILEGMKVNDSIIELQPFINFFDSLYRFNPL